jgi:hypothetical protein
LSTICPHELHCWVPLELLSHGAPQFGHGNVRAALGGLLVTPASRPNSHVSTE